MRGEEERVAESCPACGGLVECGMTKGDETCCCFALLPALVMPSAETAAHRYRQLAED